MDQEQDLGEDIVTLVDEDGKSHEFQVVDILEVNGQEYALLLPAAEGEETDEVLVLRFLEDRFELIEDEAEFQRVVKALEELSEEEA